MADVNPTDLDPKDEIREKRTLCASLRSRNEHGHVTRSICADIYRENAKRFRYHLDWTPGLNTYRNNPFSVAILFWGSRLIQQWLVKRVGGYIAKKLQDWTMKIGMIKKNKMSFSKLVLAKTGVKSQQKTSGCVGMCQVIKGYPFGPTKGYSVFWMETLRYITLHPICFQ